MCLRSVRYRRLQIRARFESKCLSPFSISRLLFVGAKPTALMYFASAAVMGYKSLQDNRRAPIIWGRNAHQIILNYQRNRMNDKLRQMPAPRSRCGQTFSGLS